MERCESGSVEARQVYLHELLLGALGTDDVLSVGDEALADERGLALRADEAVVVPVSVFERDEAGAADTCDGLGARSAALGEQFPEALGAVGLLVARSEPLAGERRVAVRAREALAVPWLVLVRHAALCDYLVTLDAAGGELVLVAAGAVDLLLARDEALRADRVLADNAAEALLVPLPGLVLHLLGSSTEHLAASIAAACELSVVTVTAVDLVELGAELLVDQRDAALGAQEAGLVPVLVLVRQILRVNADDLVALFAAVGEDAFIALDAVGVFIPKNIALAS